MQVQKPYFACLSLQQWAGAGFRFGLPMKRDNISPYTLVLYPWVVILDRGSGRYRVVSRFRKFSDAVDYRTTLSRQRSEYQFKVIHFKLLEDIET